ncbi:dTMP kinase [Streptomyces sp. NPDC015127]|uniref:dTMP kinase n=1 Tax=Streptomyces sp. NPDC015127 TaxID=3364939 RepID=UPI0036FE6E3F
MKTVIITEHPAWRMTPEGEQARVVEHQGAAWLALCSPLHEDLVLRPLTGDGAVQPPIACTSPMELPQAPDGAGPLFDSLVRLGTVARLTNPSLWDAIVTAILRQVVTAQQARKRVDGPSAVGKSTTVAELGHMLTKRGARVHTTCEPSTSELGDFTRATANHIRGRALACLVAANRYEHIDELKPLLTAGDTVICDRYLASSLVLQQLDGVPEPFVLALHADILLPDLAVILTANPEAIAGRLAERGKRHRFHDDPTGPAREVALYREAAQTLMTLGVPVLVLDSTHVTPWDVADRIADAVPLPTGTVHPNRPDDPTVTP